MEIRVASAVGRGPTPLAAFDAALRGAGVENYNLIALSSIIPPGSVVMRGRFSTPPSEYGHRLYVVMARHEAMRSGDEAWAGLGWTQESGSGRGLFVELHGSSRRTVETEIGSTLEAMKQARPYDYGKNESEIAGAVCEGEPICALVIAVYASEAWEPSVPGGTPRTPRSRVVG
jgi:arginine decarboxylase